MAHRTGHVYYSRQMPQGPDVRQQPPGEDPIADTSPVERFMSTIVGPTDPREFLNTFFASLAEFYGNFGKNLISRKYDTVPPTAAYKKFIVDPLIRILNHESAFGCRSGGDIVFCGRTEVSKSKRGHMPDIVAVHERSLIVVEDLESLIKPLESLNKPLEIDDIRLAEYFITVQPDREDDFFHDPAPEAKHLFDPRKPYPHTQFVALRHILDPEERRKATHGLERIIERVEEMRLRQRRTHMFSISIAGSMARFLRWDGSGTTITRAFDIRREPDLLDDFQSLYYRSSREVRGYEKKPEGSKKKREQK